MQPVDRPLAYARAHRTRFVAELKDFVRFPSVSAEPRHVADLRACAQWLAEQLQCTGLENVRVIRTRGHPVVYGDWCHAPGRPTVLIYGHYDVQPPDPLNEWQTPPFEPVVVGDDLHGRGACDDKGQMFVHVKMLEAYLRTLGSLPVNVKCVFEGEEEIGSPSLKSGLARCRDALVADIALMSDMPIVAPDRPAITYAMRGALSLELEVRGPGRDLHSGIFGGAVYNPLQALSEIIARLHDSNGRVAIPKFYDRVRLISAEERAYLARTGPDDAKIRGDAQAMRGWGEQGYSLYERTTIRPALTINGVSGGYRGSGVKAVIPSRAVAKFNFRLVPDQDPHEIAVLFRRYVRRNAPPAVRTTVRVSGVAAKATVIDPRLPAMRSAAVAYGKGFKATPVLLRSGGTIPVASLLQEDMGVPTVLMGFALPDDRMHAPNEKFHLPNFFNGIATSIWFLQEMASNAARHPSGHMATASVATPA